MKVTDQSNKYSIDSLSPKLQDCKKGKKQFMISEVELF